MIIFEIKQVMIATTTKKGKENKNLRKEVVKQIRIRRNQDLIYPSFNRNSQQNDSRKRERESKPSVSSKISIPDPISIYLSHRETHTPNTIILRHTEESLTLKGLTLGRRRKEAPREGLS